LLLAAGACAHRAPATQPATPAVAAATAVSPRSLPVELDRIFGAPQYARMQWAVLVQSLESGAVLYERNASKLMMPASNMKVVTLSAAAERLGWDYRYRTLLMTAAPIEEGTVRGDVEVVGSGDPTINGRSGSPTRLRILGGSAARRRHPEDRRAHRRQRGCVRARVLGRRLVVG
jgi:D-alanyl-D-alanine carboxypeptidase/D-alanyl-D-alanine-endopeptidase (penicillin-binding protein 4)